MKKFVQFKIMMRVFSFFAWLLFTSVSAEATMVATSSKKKPLPATSLPSTPSVKRLPEIRLASVERSLRPGQVWVPDGDGGGAWYPEPAAASYKLGEYTLGPKIRRLLAQLSRSNSGVFGAPRASLAAITCYWRYGKETDKWTRRGQSSTGVKLSAGVVAVDPKTIPYGSLVTIEGVPGIFLAADCGSHVSKRVAVQNSARTAAERRAIVVDVFFATEKEGRKFDSSLPRFVKVTWFPPQTSGRMMANR
jgi:3D (Asp-Asp-Asp) domain-containing protein